jgi:hypothetical protein
MAYDLADVVPLTVTIRDTTGAPADGGTVTLTVTLPDLTTATPAVTHAGVGVYQVDYVPPMPGRYSVNWVCTGTNASGYSDAFDVREAAPHYAASLADLKLQLNMTGTTDDEELRLYLEAATTVVEQHLRRAVVRRSFVEQITATGYLALTWTPVVSLTSVIYTNGSGSLTLSDLVVSAAGLVTSVTNPCLLVGDFTATYVAGPALVPANETLACLIIAQHLWETQRGTKGAAHAGGLNNPGLGFTSFGFAIPNRALELLGPPVPGVV